MRFTKRQQELAESRLAAALGRPEKRCPACGALAAHWVSERLDQYGLVVDGYYVCEVPE